jgi:hypothetical protein
MRPHDASIEASREAISDAHGSAMGPRSYLARGTALGTERRDGGKRQQIWLTMADDVSAARFARPADCKAAPARGLRSAGWLSGDEIDALVYGTAYLGSG